MATAPTFEPLHSQPVLSDDLSVGDGDIDETPIEMCKTFEEMSLKDKLLRGIFSYGFKAPSLFQQKAIKPIVCGRDVFAQAQSGLGKTFSFLIGCLQIVDPSQHFTQAVIISPTRELALNTFYAMEGLAKFLKEINILRIVGGEAVSEAAQKVAEAPQHIIVGTPHRLLHLIASEVIDASHVRIFVLDEADELLSKEYQDKIMEINSYFPKNVQTVVMTSARIAEVNEITSQIQHDPIQILTPYDNLSFDGIRQFYVDVLKEEYKKEVLFDLFETIPIAGYVIFCNSKGKVDLVTEALQSKKFKVSSIHGGLEKEDRDRIMKNFREGKSKVLVTTDLLERSIDVQHVSIVVNYDMPLDVESYIHRIGRSDYHRRKSNVINMVTEADEKMMKEIQEYYKIKIEELPANIGELFKK
ncbi:putative ATP-dependent RNA helicase eIF4A [Monocercomonoides exilis]|uniref:putative ATP-dependent RNA helicase eIF4A n=1 Tax=Monocercomonoides exilis TaxID=2049356 RepID=UPI0035597173|nr:putative ATP-dependent RNA helicase eIF4A [Monocercomonoides exilis]|eukprot:MONOS_3126.1-p1 / transcript=MONOS_3126.1 / gene=MONOS_3126 / organism=Monocercomonoides_exilis_PA203 / gene_product=ATP-dependent RNA helicase eIF4A / transcript_product=ATP-dependent RNA helicase eIF4A / location=Mono_scaffold00070:142006-143417(+) / protein_length=413 / sequence_SO=supercontig / SO=protein_coding / is_pseudo=false